MLPLTRAVFQESEPVPRVVSYPHNVSVRFQRVYDAEIAIGSRLLACMFLFRYNSKHDNLVSFKRVLLVVFPNRGDLMYDVQVLYHVPIGQITVLMVGGMRHNIY